MEGYAETCFAKHGKVVGSVAYGYGLCKVHLLNLSYEFEQFRLSFTVYYLSLIPSGELAVVTNFQLVGIDIVYSVFALQVFTEIGKTTAEDGNLISTPFQYRHQSIYSLRNGHGIGDILHDACVESLQQSHPAGKALPEVDLASHGTLRNGSYLRSDASPFGKLVYALRLNERRIHIEADETTHAAVHIVFLERKVNLHVRRYPHKLFLHGSPVDGSASKGELYACTYIPFGVHDAYSASQTAN